MPSKIWMMKSRVWTIWTARKMIQLPLLHLQPAAAEAAVVYIASSVSSASDVWCVSLAVTSPSVCNVCAARETPMADALAVEQILRVFLRCVSRDDAYKIHMTCRGCTGWTASQRIGCAAERTVRSAKRFMPRIACRHTSFGGYRTSRLLRLLSPKQLHHFHLGIITQSMRITCGIANVSRQLQRVHTACACSSVAAFVIPNGSSDGEQQRQFFDQQHGVRRAMLLQQPCVRSWMCWCRRASCRARAKWRITAQSIMPGPSCRGNPPGYVRVNELLRETQTSKTRAQNRVVYQHARWLKLCEDGECGIADEHGMHQGTHHTPRSVRTCAAPIRIPRFDHHREDASPDACTWYMPCASLSSL